MKLYFPVLLFATIVAFSLAKCTQPTHAQAPAYYPPQCQQITDSITAVYQRRIDSIYTVIRTNETAAVILKAQQTPTVQAHAPADSGETYTAKDGTTYDVHTGTRGGRYIIRTSRDGNQYKQYLK